MKDDDRTTQPPNMFGFGAAWPMSTMWPKDWLVPMLLLLVRQWSSYGYELMERMTSFGVAMMNPGTFYRILRQMEKDGYVSSSWDTAGAGPARRIYSITDAGEAYLKLWADSLEQYQTMMERFTHLYTGQPEGGDAKNQR